MANTLHEDGLGSKGMSAITFAELHGLSIAYVRKLCKDGKIFGARLHPLTKKWWIYPPAKLLCGTKRKPGGSTSNRMPSTLHGVEQA